jgi:hypothetical protein
VRRSHKALRAALLASVAMALPTIGRADGLLFHLTGDKGLKADVAAGEATPNFADKVKLKTDPVHGAYIEASSEQVLSWMAPATSRPSAARSASSGARPRAGRDRAVPVMFRVGYADHTSWDMAFLRIDWNGHGFDAFVTDNGLAAGPVSFDHPSLRQADAWTHLAFTWDETKGVRSVRRRQAGGCKKETKAVYDAGLDQFGPHGRVVSPHQVQSAYNFIRGGDGRHPRLRPRAGDADAVAALAATGTHGRRARRQTWTIRPPRRWRLRYGWNRPTDPPPYLADAATTIRKVEFTDVKDLKEWMWKGSDGIAETTWPGVYNRSRLPGRNDYFQLPDWNVYVDGGKALTSPCPTSQWNRLEIQGPAYGDAGRPATSCAARRARKAGAHPQRPVHQPLKGGVS